MKDMPETVRPAVVDRETWLAARRALLDQEKALTRAQDAVAAHRRALPWVRVETDYVFATEAGPRSLADLFAGRGQLIVYHFMFAPDWAAGCASCSFLADHIDGARAHLAARDVELVCVSRAPLEGETGSHMRQPSASNEPPEVSGTICTVLMCPGGGLGTVPVTEGSRWPWYRAASGGD